MRKLKIICIVFFLAAYSLAAYAATINVFVNVRGNTGVEDKISSVMAKELSSYDMVSMVDNGEKSQLYLDISVVEQKAIRFYGLGISIAYHLNGNYYSRPTSDVAQFGIDRMEEVCVRLVQAIDEAYLEPLRKRDEE